MKRAQNSFNRSTQKIIKMQLKFYSAKNRKTRKISNLKLKKYHCNK